MGIASFPLTLHKGTCVLIHSTYPTGVSVRENINTFFDVGLWSWNWVDPPMATLMFCILLM